MEYVIFWGYDPHSNKPRFCAHQTIQDQVSSPSTVDDQRVTKFKSQDQAQTHVENECLNHGSYRIITITEAGEL